MRVAAVLLESTKNSKQATTRIMILLSKLASPGLTFTPHGTLPEVKEALIGYAAAHVNSKQHLLSMLLTYHYKRTRVDSYRTS